MLEVVSKLSNVEQLYPIVLLCRDIMMVVFLSHIIDVFSWSIYLWVKGSRKMKFSVKDGEDS